VTTSAPGTVPSIFDGLSEDDVTWILDHLERRKFEAGQTILAEGDAPGELYIVESGETDVFMEDDRGNEHLLNRLGAGATLGEMSLFTGHPVSATIRAASNLVVLVMTQPEFRRIATTYPRIYENLGAALSQRLVASNRRALREDTTRITTLVDGGGPPLAGYALAASIAWHSGKPALLVVAGELDEDLAALARGDAAAPEDGQMQPRAYIAQLSSLGGTLDEAVRKGTSLYPHVVALIADGEKPPAHAHPSLRLVGRGGPAAGDTKTAYALRAWVEPNGRRRPDVDGELRIAPLQAEDEESLRDGVLPISTPAGNSIGAAARDVTEARVGVALGGGAIRGWAHIGVLDGLLRSGVPIDFIVGTSIGAIVASSYAFGHSPDETAEALYKASAKIFRPRIMRGGLISNIGIRHGLESSFKDARIENTATPLAVTATDIVQQREVVLRTGLLWEGALASATIPGVFPPMQVGGLMLVDGGVVNPVPSNVLADLGANILIGVKLTRAASRSTRARPNRVPRLIDIFTSTFELMQSKITTETAAASTLLIEPTFPETSGFGLRQFPEGRRYIPIGEEAVEAALPRLNASLPWLRGKRHHTINV
jgi:NTE family protein